MANSRRRCRGRHFKSIIGKICTASCKPIAIEGTAYEIDSSFLPTLRKEFRQLQRACDRHRISFSATILNADFVKCATEIISRTLFETDSHHFNAAILNPPYRKISGNRIRRLLRTVGIERAICTPHSLHSLRSCSHSRENSLRLRRVAFAMVLTFDHSGGNC